MSAVNPKSKREVTLSQTLDFAVSATACQVNSPDDRRHFVTLNIYLCLQRDQFDAAQT